MICEIGLRIQLRMFGAARDEKLKRTPSRLLISWREVDDAFFEAITQTIFQFSSRTIPSGFPSFNSSGSSDWGLSWYAIRRVNLEIACVPTEVLRPSEVAGKGPP